MLLCELDNFIYPIVRVPDGTGYTICNVFVHSLERLKDKKVRPTLDDQMICTGVAYVAHFVCMLSTITGIPLRFPIKYENFLPIIVDGRIDVFEHKQFPLYARGNDRTYFDYGVELLSRNIAQLRVYFGLPSVDFNQLLGGLYGLMKHFHQKRTEFASAAARTDSGIMTMTERSESCLSNTSTRCPTPDRPLVLERLRESPDVLRPQTVRTLKETHRFNSSAPNLVENGDKMAAVSERPRADSDLGSGDRAASEGALEERYSEVVTF